MAELPRDRPDTSDAIRALVTADGVAASTAPLRGDALDDALSMIGSALGQPAVVTVEGAQRVRDVSAASGWMPWRVQLSGRWFERLPVPVLASVRGIPTVIVSEGSTTTAIEGGTRVASRVTQRTAADVDPTAVAYAPDLPRTTRWWSLVGWSLRNQHRDLALFVAIAALGGLGTLLLPIVTGAIFQSAIPRGDLPLVLFLLGAFALASLGFALLALFRGRLVVGMRDRMDTLLAAGSMARLLRVKAGFFRARSVGDIANRVQSVESARQAVDDAVLSLLVAATFGLVGLAYLFAAGATIGLISTVAVAVVLTVSVTVQWRGRSFMPPLLERRSQTDAYLLSLLENATSWRTSGGEGRALGLWAQVQRGSTRAMADRLRSISLSGPVEAAAPTAVLVAFVVAVVILPVPALEPGNPAATGLFLALYAAVAQVTIAVLALGANLITLSEYGPQLARLEPILEAPTEQDRSPGHPGELRGAVSLRGVEFGYRGDRPPLFSGLSLDVAPGEFVAIVGPSGSGKSTLLRLMLGFEDPWEGTVSYDGIDLTQLDAPAVRRQLGTVLQSSRLLGSTVRECIGGPLMLSQERLDDVVERAGLAEDIAGLPDGLDSLVGEGGSALSGGQRQRLLIASALARDPAIFLLDEATSALDNQTQAVVMRTILTSTATRIVVAHRLSTVRRADRVVVVAHGGIAEQGAPDDLIAAGGLFARLAARQEA